MLSHAFLCFLFAILLANEVSATPKIQFVFEGKSSEEEKSRECIFFKDPEKDTKDTYIFSNCKIIVESISSKDKFKWYIYFLSFVGSQIQYVA